jgi:azurin
MKNFPLYLCVVAAAAMLTGCGGGGEQQSTAPAENETAAQAPAAAAASTPPPAAASARVVQLTGDDTMHYNIKEITAAPGESLRVELKNIGRLPKQTMSHNFVLVQPMTDADIAKLATAAATKPPTYMPADQSKVIVQTKMLGPGESDAIEFQAPAEPGTYPYFCTFPGHFALMRGNLIVK